MCVLKFGVVLRPFDHFSHFDGNLSSTRPLPILDNCMPLTKHNYR